MESARRCEQRPGARTSRGRRSADPHRNEDLLALALDEQSDALGLAREHALDLLDRRHGLAVDREQHVARLDAGALGGAADVLDDEAVVELGLALLVTRQRPERQSERA